MSLRPTADEYRTGIGTDIHCLVPDKPLILGGVEVPCEMGLLAHSDGDVVVHAVIDAILGATCLGDIGELFPDTDEKFAGADSMRLLLTVRELMEADGWHVENLDVVIKAQRPRLSPWKAQIKRSLADCCGANFKHVNVKAKTNEGLGAVGRGEAIEALANVLLKRTVKI
ncbi:MAG: 2-C-methyl-D-erythritol 2,4-cyclodiphosphate synthase [Phycisphaerae bacterium]